jgi:hypothetical protein
MTTPHRTLQMALDALDAITDDVDGTGLNTMPSFDKAIDAIAALREALAPDHLRDVAEKVAPAAPVVREPRHVRKVGGSFQHTGTVVAEFQTTAGEPRIVLEFDAPVAGMLHVYRPDQVEPCEPVAPAQPVPQPAPRTADCLMCGHCAATGERVAKPAVPLTEGRITAIANELAYAGGLCNVYEFARAIEAAHGITGGKP